MKNYHASLFNTDAPRTERRKRPVSKRWENYMPYRFEVFGAVRALLLQSDRLLTRKDIIAALPDTEVRDINATLAWAVANNEFSQDRFFDPPRYGVSDYIPSMNEAKLRAEGPKEGRTGGSKLPTSAIERIVKELVNMPETVKNRSISAAIRQLLMDSQRHLRKDIQDQLEKLGYTNVQALSNIAAGIGKYLDADPERTYVWLNDKGRRQLIKEEGGHSDTLTPAVQRERNLVTAGRQATLEERLGMIEDAAGAAPPEAPPSIAAEPQPHATLMGGLADLGEVPERIKASYLAKRRVGLDHEAAKSAAMRGMTLREAEQAVPAYNPETHAPSGRRLEEIQESVGTPRRMEVSPEWLAQKEQEVSNAEAGAGAGAVTDTVPPGEFPGVAEPKPGTPAHEHEQALEREERQQPKAAVRDKADRALIDAADKLAAERLDRSDQMLRDATALLERIEGLTPHGGERELPDNAQAYLSWDDRLVLAPTDTEVLYFSAEQTLKLAMMLSKLLK